MRSPFLGFKANVVTPQKPATPRRLFPGPDGELRHLDYAAAARSDGGRVCRHGCGG